MSLVNRVITQVFHRPLSRQVNQVHLAVLEQEGPHDGGQEDERETVDAGQPVGERDRRGGGRIDVAVDEQFGDGRSRQLEQRTEQHQHHAEGDPGAVGAQVAQQSSQQTAVQGFALDLTECSVTAASHPMDSNSSIRAWRTTIRA